MCQLATITLNQKELVIDEEFRNLIPKLTNAEYEQLGKNIKGEKKCRDSIITWNGTIIDGHNRYDICTRNNIDFHTVSKDFKNRDEVKLWIIDNQFGRRNLTKYDRSVLALKKKVIISANAKKNQGTRTDISQKSVKSIDTQKKLAKDAGISHDTIYKVEVIERSATEDQKNKIRNQTSTINKVFKDIAKQQKRENFRRENAKLAEQYVEDKSITIIHGDFYAVCKDLEENSVDLVLTDLPYPKEYIHLWEQLGETAGRLLKPSGFLVSYSGHMYLDRVMHDLGQHLNFYWILSLLHSGPTQLVNPRNVIAEFKPVLVYQKPPLKKLEGSPLRDVITKDNRDKDFHEWGQGELGVEMLMNHFSKPNDLVLDPCLGGGTTLLVAKKLKRRAIGIDIDLQCIKTTQSRLVKNHYENKTEFKPAIVEKLGLTEEDLKKPEIDKDRVTHGDDPYSINQFEGWITEILAENNTTTKDVVSARFPHKSDLSKDEIQIVWVNDDDETDPSGPDASPQLLKADDYEVQEGDPIKSVKTSRSSPEITKNNSRFMNRVVCADCFNLAKQIENNSIDLGFTSPPYADTKSYGKGVKVFHPDDYVDWILPLLNEIARILKPTGSFILNINDRIVNKQRHPYVHELIVRAVKMTPLKLYDVYFWNKPTALPNGNSRRLNNVTEYLIHFCKDQNQVKWNMDAVREPYDENTVKRCQYPVGGFHLEVDKEGKAMGRKRKMIQLNGKGKIPSNVFHFPTASAVRGKKHPAAFHIDLPSWFIKALTNEGDVVTDVFSGSGSTCLAAKKLNRKFIGIEMNEGYHKIAEKRVENAVLAKAA